MTILSFWHQKFVPLRLKITTNTSHDIRQYLAKTLGEKYIWLVVPTINTIKRQKPTGGNKISYHHQLKIWSNFVFCEYLHVKSKTQYTNRTKYSRMDQVKFFKSCLPQILLGPFLNTLSQIVHRRVYSVHVSQFFHAVHFWKFLLPVLVYWIRNTHKQLEVCNWYNLGPFFNKKFWLFRLEMKSAKFPVCNLSC